MLQPIFRQFRLSETQICDLDIALALAPFALCVVIPIKLWVAEALTGVV